MQLGTQTSESLTPEPYMWNFFCLAAAGRAPCWVIEFTSRTLTPRTLRMPQAQSATKTCLLVCSLGTWPWMRGVKAPARMSGFVTGPSLDGTDESTTHVELNLLQTEMH